MPVSANSNLLALALLILGSTAQAAQWAIDPNVSMKAGYDDNIRNTPDDKIGSSELTLVPSVTFSATTPRSGINGSVAMTFRRYPETEGLDDNNGRIGIQSHYKTRRSEYGLSADLIQDTTLDSQLDETGLVFDRSNRFQQAISPSWTWRLSPRLRLRGSYTYTNVNYENTGTGLADYWSQRARLALNRTFTERLSGNISVSQSMSDSDADIRSTNTNLQSGFTWNFSETLSASLSAGGRRSVSRLPERVPVFFGPTLVGIVDTGTKTESSSTGAIFDASVSKKLERADLSLSASRNVNNTVAGVQIEVTRVGFGARYRFSDRVSGRLGLNWYQTDSAGDTESIKQRRQAARASVNWQLTQFWRLSASYDYSRQEFESIGDDAVRNKLYLTLVYHWPRIAISR